MGDEFGDNNGAQGFPDLSGLGSRSLRSGGNLPGLLLQQREHLAALIVQCCRGIQLANRTGNTAAGPRAIAVKIEAIEKLWRPCQMTQAELMLQHGDPGVAAYLAETVYQEARDKYFEVMEKLVDVQDSVTTQRVQPSEPTAAPTSMRVSALEKISIPEFNGDVNDWPQFKDLFCSLVVEDRSISDVIKFSYLKRSLTGLASALIKNIPVTNDNFTSSWQLVCNHYQDVQLLTFTHIARLLKLPPVNLTKSGQLEKLVISTREVLTSLENLKEPIEQWSSLLVVLTLLRLDSDTRKDWERHVGKRDTFPKYKELETFLQTRIHSEAVAAVKSGVTTNESPASSNKRDVKVGVQKLHLNSHVSTSAVSSCRLCQSNHDLAMCTKFIQMSPEDRLNKIRSLRVCYNCFKKGHLPRDCRLKLRCSQCSRRHSTHLHDALASTLSRPASAAVVNEAVSTSTSVAVSSHTAAPFCINNEIKNALPKESTVLLATAWVQATSAEGRIIKLRALIDQGSERSFISHSAARLLGSVRKPFDASVVGIGGHRSGHVKQLITVTLSSLILNERAISADLLILEQLTSYVPRRYAETVTWDHVGHLSLADNDPQGNQAIDLILGADVYGAILLEGVLKFPNEPVAQNTIFGWILSGPFKSLRDSASTTINALHVISNADLNQSIQKFWEIESIPSQCHLNAEDQRCEDNFRDTTTRDETGRYHVTLPFKQDPPVDIGESYAIAWQCYNRLERRLQRDPELSQHYNTFLKEYVDLGHMSVYEPEESGEQTCYLPHHPVVKVSSSSTKVRVVYNASSRTSNGSSLNEHLFVGPKLQQDLASILMRWRMHRFVMVADVKQMFRQIRVSHADSRYQLILWRPSPESPVETFRLETVTYGTAPAPYLALRVVAQLADDEQLRFPLGAAELHENIYVDDVLFGASTFKGTQAIRDELIAVTDAGCLPLRKWSSNSVSLLNDLPLNHCGSSTIKELRIDDNLKVLGVQWCVAGDYFNYIISADFPDICTKRTVLSFASKLFDPVGWISPIIIVAKIFMRQLWLEKVSWDSPLPSTLVQQWTSFHSDLVHISHLRVPRWVGTLDKDSEVEIHGFCDASQDAYAATIYLRVLNGTETRIHLITSKSRVAPVKTLTIPRLELCAAELLTRLLHWTCTSLHYEHVPSYAWSDSSVTLDWIAGSPSRWKTFVANRVARIQDRCPATIWGYVPTEENPADLASRGSTPAQLQASHLWWHGPSWLRGPSDLWPKRPSVEINPVLEERAVHTHVAQAAEWELIRRYSDWGKLVRVTSLIIKFIYLLKRSCHRKRALTESSIQADDLIDHHEQSRIHWLRTIQEYCFPSELQTLRTGSSLARSSKLIALDPYLDEKGLLRLRGRLRNIDLMLDYQHPIILAKHPLTYLIIKHAHLRTLHGGTSLTTRNLFERYWIIRAKVLVRSIISHCVICARYRAQLCSQRMGDLPGVRITRSRPFDNVGVDYAGPIAVKISSGRGRHTHKGYIAVYVCLATRAVHIELVYDYSSQAFLASFHRFCARRGLPARVFSDNGTTFQGASRELVNEFRALTKDPNLAAVLANDGTSWEFIPPSSPHFGGIWESGVKSVKHHLRRIIGEHTLTGEELYTLLCRIEAVLNSRPMAGFSSDPDDLSYLTPGHLLIGAPLIAVPERSVVNAKQSMLSRWKLIQAMSERFWKVWTLDYLRTLQKRQKWRETQTNVKVGDIVLLQNDNLPPSKWNLGRVVQCFLGKDNLVRVCEIRTASSLLKRPIHKLCVLPVAEILE